MRFVFLAAFATGAAFGQVARVDVYTPSAMVIVGEELRLAVAARTAQEAIVQDAPFTFTSSNAAILSVDARGAVRGMRPGQANITVRSGNMQNVVEIMAAPKRIAVEPSERDIAVGERVQYTATAFDTNDAPIPNVTFTWSVTGANGGQINAATIATTGLLSTNGVSQATVRANLNYTARADRIPPQLIGVARVNVRPRIDYRATRLASTEDFRSAFTMRRVLANIAGNDRGQLVFRASLDGMASCVVLYEAGKFSCIASAGEARPLGGNIVTPFGQPAINNKGDVLFGASGIGLMLVDKDGHARYPVQDGAYFGDIVMAGGFNVAKKSLNDYGDIVFACSYRRTSDNVTLRGLARLNEGEPEFVWNSEQPLAGITGTPSLEDWGIDRDGVVHFQAAGSTGRGIFRAERFQAPRRVIGGGETNEGSAVTSVTGLQVAEDGAIAFLINRQNGVTSIGRVRAGSTAIETVRTTGNPSNPLAINAAAGIVFRGDTGAGYGLYRWQGAAAPALALARRNTPGGEAVTAFNAAALTAGGEIFAQAATAAREFALFSAAEGAPSILQTNGPIEVSARLHLPVANSLIAGERPGSPRLRLGDVRSAYELDGGKLTPKLVDLDMLPDGNRFFGDSASFEEPGGDLMFVVNNTIFRQRAAGVEMVLRNQATTDDNQRLSFSTGIRPAINPAGAMALVAATATGERRIYLRTPAGQLQLMGAVNSSRVAGGDVITAVRSLAIDNLGRVMAFLDVRNTPASLYTWTGRDWVAVAIPGSTDVAGLPIRDFVRGPIAGGNKFYLIVNRGTQAQTIPTVLEYGADRWTAILTAGDALPHGGSMSSFGLFDVNDRGDLAFVANGNTGGSTALMLRTGDGNLRTVQQLIRPVTPDGEYVSGFSEVDVRSDGRIYFASMTIKDAYMLFLAEPAR